MSAKFEKPDDPDRDARAEARTKALAATAQVAELIKERGILDHDIDAPPAVLEDEALRTAYKQTIDDRGKLSSIFCSVLITNFTIWQTFRLSWTLLENTAPTAST